MERIGWAIKDHLRRARRGGEMQSARNRRPTSSDALAINAVSVSKSSLPDKSTIGSLKSLLISAMWACSSGEPPLVKIRTHARASPMIDHLSPALRRPKIFPRAPNPDEK